MGGSKPRASGDDPRIELLLKEGGKVNPARAGMILYSIDSYFLALSKPRASGDDPANIRLHLRRRK